MKIQKNNVFISLGLVVLIVCATITTTAYVANTNERIERIENKLDISIKQHKRSRKDLKAMIKTMAHHCCEPGERYLLYDDLYSLLEEIHEN